ncbi:class I glutamine amidotransferase-like protein [Suillus paluster]|uniref:class I glutamine amidotransferase-like protein n=1 Tax=Suillus paluster TaxID=48578 RepID=UPI001B885E5A|nr:class I glutamine amidotransferase-like protein [Suillus paluster]KAG1753978.1 class I glutamine amidotransferase-like protein [Suillus paluster]
MTKRILFVFTSANRTLTGASTGWYLPEAAHPYYVLVPHFAIDFASPEGPNPPVDEYSVQTFPDDIPKFLEDPEVQKKLSTAKKLSEVKPDDYDAVFYVGGHGPVLDLAVDPTNIHLGSAFYRAGKVVAAVCHGPAALVGVTDNSGKSIFAGKPFTGFSNDEEEQIGKVKDLPFLLEDKISSLGGKYEKAAEPWGAKVVVTGNLITGQNPASAYPVGEAMLQALQK